MTPQDHEAAAAKFQAQINAMTAELRASQSALKQIAEAFNHYEMSRIAYQGRGPEVQAAFANFLTQAQQITTEHCK